MRLHPRRKLFLLCSVFVFSCLAVFIYTKTTYLNKRKKGVLNFHKNNHDNNDKHFFWTKDSGVIKAQHKLGFPASVKRNRMLGDKLNYKHSNDYDPLLSDTGYSEDEDKEQSKNIKFNMNVLASDLIPLNREVPDSRPQGCKKIKYPHLLPSTSIVIPFHNEWPSVLVRSVHSLIERSPKHLLKKIILVDDASDLKSLKSRLSNYMKWTFPEDLVKIIRLSSRHGLIRARLEGLKEVTSETVSFFDSHMEVNYDWLQPLLYEIKQNRQTVAMAQLDYIDNKNFKYNFYEHYRTRYGFKWDMEFFETFFRPDQLAQKTETDPLPGVLMVGPAFVVDTEYFKELGTYDSAMKIWGGENIEFAWRTWMCGGKMLHVPCSHVGHVERSQPYTFPGGRRETEMFNYKRAVDVWLGPYKEYVYDAVPGIRDIDVGDLTERLKVKSRLNCKNFTWFLHNVWPELLPYKNIGELWGQIKSDKSEDCLDNDGYLFQDPSPLMLKPCSFDIQRQTFALSASGHLRTLLHCVVVQPEGPDLLPFLQNCFLNNTSTWLYRKDQHLVHEYTEMCLQVMTGGKLVLQTCRPNQSSQKWIFKQNLWESLEK